MTARDSFSCKRSKTFECFHLFCYEWSRSPRGVWEESSGYILVSWGGKLFQNVSGLPYGRETEPSGALADWECVAVPPQTSWDRTPSGESNWTAPSLLCTN